MWTTIINWILGLFGTNYKSFLGWFSPTKLFTIALAFLALLVFYLTYSGYQKNKEIVKIKSENIEILKNQIQMQHNVNIRNQKEINKIQKDINKTLILLSKLEKKTQTRRIKNAIQKQKNEHFKDGNLSPVLINTFNWLREQNNTTTTH